MEQVMWLDCRNAKFMQDIKQTLTTYLDSNLFSPFYKSIPASFYFATCNTYKVRGLPLAIIPTGTTNPTPPKRFPTT